MAERQPEMNEAMCWTEIFRPIAKFLLAKRDWACEIDCLISIL